MSLPLPVDSYRVHIFYNFSFVIFLRRCWAVRLIWRRGIRKNLKIFTFSRRLGVIRLACIACCRHMRLFYAFIANNNQYLVLKKAICSMFCIVPLLSFYAT